MKELDENTKGDLRNIAIRLNQIADEYGVGFELEEYIGHFFLGDDTSTYKIRVYDKSKEISIGEDDNEEEIEY